MEHPAPHTGTAHACERGYSHGALFLPHLRLLYGERPSEHDPQTKVSAPPLPLCTAAGVTYIPAVQSSYDQLPAVPNIAWAG